MSTRGFVGFVVDGTEKIAYNHSDSYPDGLGLDVLRWLRTADLDAIREQALTLRVVAADSKPTDEDIERLSGFANRGVGTRDLDDWYVLLRKTQGNPKGMLAAGVIEDASGFPADSLFAEWGYVVDLDARALEVFEGFQKQSHDKGRFAGRQDADDSRRDGYWPVALVSSWPLSALPTDDEFMAAVEPQNAEA
jgi:hypothetical protein